MRLVYWCVTAVAVTGLLYVKPPIFAWLFTFLILAIILWKSLQYTFGRITDSGIEYRRMFSWHMMLWGQIESISRDSFTGLIAIQSKSSDVLGNKLLFYGRRSLFRKAVNHRQEALIDLMRERQAFDRVHSPK